MGQRGWFYREVTEERKGKRDERREKRDER